MINAKELYVQSTEQALRSGESIYGTTYVRYEVRQITDVRNLTATRAYRIVCSQRIVLPNPDPFELTPGKWNAMNFENYPALLSSRFALAGGGLNLRLIDYSPRTMNTTIMTSASQSDGASKSFSQQHTTGSSVAQTNTYGGSASIGFWGDDPTASVSQDYSNSSTSEQSSSQSTGTDSGSSQEHSGSASMSIKDWGSYAYLDTGSTSPAWIWGQEYPWDIIQYHYCEKNNAVALPPFVLARLFDSLDKPTLVFPPSQLALFGVDFTMKAVWQIELSSDPTQQSVTVNHTVQYLTASHGLNNGTPYVTVTPAPTTFTVQSPALDVTLLGLDPIRSGASDNGAVIGFIASKFIISPTAAGDTFKTISQANTLQVTGKGFTAPLSTDFPKGAPATLTVQFKIIDDTTDYALFMKHWKVGDAGCELKFVFNGDEANPVFRHVDANEGEGGEDNLSTVALRNRDYTSIDYHDYLVMGLNTVVITITPETTTSATTYLLRAIAIGES